MKVVSVVGARPQFVKAFVVSRALRRDHEEILVHTGQHYDEELSDVFFEELELPEPDYNLEVGSGAHAEQTARMMIELDSVVESESPDVLNVYGDTNSTLAGSVVGSKRDTTLVHVEAGLRSYDRSMPEEVNRVLTDHASDLLFAPSKTAVNNLREEGLTDGVYLTGDVMYDAVLWARSKSEEVSDIHQRLDLECGEYVLTTVHRAANTNEQAPLESILDALVDLDRTVVFPAHPRVAGRMREFGLLERVDDGLQLIDPVGYFDFVSLLDHASVVATDSGGVQKEAFFLETPCVTLRDETEWVETVESGWNTLVGADTAAIKTAVTGATVPNQKPDIYGDGAAAERIVSSLEEGHSTR